MTEFEVHTYYSNFEFLLCGNGKDGLGGESTRRVSRTLRSE